MKIYTGSVILRVAVRNHPDAEASYPYMQDFVSSPHEEASPPRMKIGWGYFHVSIKSADDLFFNDR
jgi:hypothetical protein